MQKLARGISLFIDPSEDSDEEGESGKKKKLKKILSERIINDPIILL